MGRLRYLDITNVVFIGMLFCGLAEATGQNAITSLTSNSSNIEMHNKFIMKGYSNGCECDKYDCGCCQQLKWDAIFMDGKLCINATSLDNDYGISLTVTYNNFAIFNETISARNPPPICFGEDIVDAMEVEICLRIYNIDYRANKFHGCFEVLGKIMRVTVTRIKLGCIHTELHKMKNIKNNISVFLKKAKEDLLPNVIMVK